MWMAGGGIEGGRSYGATNEIGDTADEGGMDIHDWHATVLHAMGLADRAEVRICRSGSPCIIEVAQTRLGLAASVACRIFTTPCGAACPAAADAGGRTIE